MFSAVDTKDAPAVAREVRALFHSSFPAEDDGFITRSFDTVVACFTGQCPGYRPLDARYHDIEHTMQGTLCLARLLGARHAAGALPLLTPGMFELALLGILLHDTGYLKRSNDTTGTGAKYTLTHVRRSADFARDFLAQHAYSEADAAAVQNMIRCTGVNADLAAIPFSSELEKMVGYALGTADLLGQMAADDYIDKLPVLYEEFAEAARFSAGQGGAAISFKSVEDLTRNTPVFWRNYVWPKLNEDFSGLFHFLSSPYPDGPNEYIDRIRANIARIERHTVAGA